MNPNPFKYIVITASGFKNTVKNPEAIKFKDVKVGQEFIHPWAGRMRKIEAVDVYYDAVYLDGQHKDVKCSISDTTEVVLI